MSIYVGIDPGPSTCGVVVYADGAAQLAHPRATLDECRLLLQELAADSPTVVLEHTHPGPPSWSVIHTTVMLGRLWEAAEGLGLVVSTVHRRDVKALLGGSDSLIRRSILARHNLDPSSYHHTHDTPLQGVTSHAWQALAAVLTHQERGQSNGMATT